MSRIVVAILASIIALVPLAAVAQPGAPASAAPPTVELRGKIVDTANKPIPSASVSLRPKGSTVTVAGAIAGEDGNFRITGLRPGAFTIRVVYIGYSPVIQDITVTAAKPVMELGVAKLAPIAVTLEAVTSRDIGSAVITEPDRNAYRAKDIAPGAANASELLENVPAVQVDIDGKVSLRGNENVVVQINGRATPMSGVQLAAYLKTLPASTIDRIEVMPNPSAKYDPEGMAGIINIALKSTVDLGLSAGVNAQAANRDKYNASGNVGYQVGRWTSFLNTGLNVDDREITGIDDREYYTAASSLLGFTGQDLRVNPLFKGQNLNATVEYKLSSRDLLSNVLTLNRRSIDEASTTAFTVRDGSGNTLDQYTRPRDQDMKGSLFDYDVVLKRTITPRVHEISTELRYNRAHDEALLDQRRLVTGSTTQYRDGQIDRNDAVNGQLTGQVDYLKAFRPRTKVETGWKSTLRRIDRDFGVTTDAAGTGTWTTSPLSNALEFDEGVHAVYGVLSHGVNKWDLQAGLRGEYATRTFSIASGHYPYDYRSLFPSAIALYNLDASTQLKSSYSRRVRRPAPQELNPFPVYFGSEAFMGNPELSPEYTDAWELGFTKTGPKGMLQLAPFYRHTTNIIRAVATTGDSVGNREVTTISFRNLAKNDSWGSDLSAQLRVSPRLNVLTNFSVFKRVTDGGSASAVALNTVGWNGRANVTAEPIRTVTLQAMYNYNVMGRTERGDFGAMHSANVMLRKTLQNEKGAVTFRVTDPFATIRTRILLREPTLMQLTQRNMHVRSVWLGYQYTFGRPPRVRQVPEETGGGSVGFAGPPG